jgi:hypothetical protein
MLRIRWPIKRHYRTLGKRNESKSLFRFDTRALKWSLRFGDFSNCPILPNLENLAFNSLTVLQKLQKLRDHECTPVLKFMLK